MAQQPISLQSPVGDSEETTLVISSRTEAPKTQSDMTAIVLLKEKNQGCPGNGSPTENGKSSSNDLASWTATVERVEEVGRQFQVTRERIRQIEAKALRQNAAPTRIRQAGRFP